MSSLTSALDPVPADVLQLFASLDPATPIWCVAHVDPDADAIGSAYGFAHAAREAGFDGTFVVWDGAPYLPRSCERIPGTGRAVPMSVADALLSTSPGEGLVVTFDTPTLARLGDGATLLDHAAASIKIDHHQTDETFGSHQWVESSTSATAIMVYRLIKALDWPINESSATALYAGLMLDTRDFTTRMDSQALAVREALLPSVVDVDALRASVLPRRSHRYEDLLRVAMSSAQLFSTDGLYKALVSVDDAQDRGVGWEEADALPDDLVHVLRNPAEAADGVVGKFARTAEVVAVIRERERFKKYKVHFRAVDPEAGIDVAALAGLLGGGGHRHEAAATLEPMDDEPLNIVAVNRMVANAYRQWSLERQVQRGLQRVETSDTDLALPTLAI